jgi:ferric-dicitrate binding protein FerR (iron transport regulator)
MAVFSFGGLLAVFAFGAWLANSPQHQLTFADVLPWLTAGVAALKGVAALCSLRALNHRGILPQRVFWGALAAWIVFAAGLFGVLCWLLPGGQTFVWAIVLGIVLLLPLTRLALAPLALDWNRHR